MTNTYIIGQVIELGDLITDPDTDTPVDDASELCTVYDPDGITSTPTILPGAANSGQYRALFTPTKAGWHEYVFMSTGAGAGAGRGRFYVSPVP